MKIALVHDFFTQLGGAERVLDEFLQIYPQAPIFTLVYNGQKTGHVFDKYRIKTSFIQKLPGAQKDYRWYLSLMPAAVSRLDFSGFDTVLADTSAYVKGVKVPKSTMLVCYCHTPTRLLWQLDYKDYMASHGYPKSLAHIISPVIRWLKNWDYRAAQRPHFYIANSKNVQARIRRFYQRDSVVVYPPVDTEFFKPSGAKGNYFLLAGRLEYGKGIALAMAAFNQLGWPLKVAGAGRDFEKLKAQAGPHIEFLGRISDAELRQRYSEARAFIFPVDEDAGLAPVEAMSCGTPVIALAAGGALETVIDGKTGLFFNEPTVESLVAALQRFVNMDFDPNFIRAHALQFDKMIFREKIKSLLENWHRQFHNSK